MGASTDFGTTIDHEGLGTLDLRVEPVARTLGREDADAPAGTLRGSLALAGALRAEQFDFLSYVPGSPATAFIDACATVGMTTMDCGNEVLAALVAVGRAVDGRSAVMAFKGVGLMVASEVLAEVVGHQTNGPVVVVVGDDPGSSSSTVPTDSRSIAASIAVPVLEPYRGRSFMDCTRAAKRLSLEAKRPVMIRITSAIEQLSSPAVVGRVTAGAP